MRKKKSEREKTIEQLDRIHSKLVRAIWTRCVTCGTAENLQCGHIFSRNTHNTRWDYEERGNCYTQCRGCNLLHEHDSYPYFEWYRLRYGQRNFTKLRKRYKTQRKFKTYELIEMIELFKILLNDIETKKIY